MAAGWLRQPGGGGLEDHRFALQTGLVLFNRDQFELGAAGVGVAHERVEAVDDQADVAVQVAKDTVKEFIDKGPSDDELTASMRNITGGFPLRIDSNRDVVEYLAVIGFYGLPMDYLNVFNDNITAVSKETIRSAFKRRVKPEHMVTVIVGG